MGTAIRRSGYSARAWLLALFVVFALVLGGGGTPNPLTEVLVELATVVFALAWVWLPPDDSAGAPAPVDRWLLALIAIPLVVPVVQLVPLPPSIWTSLPGRENAVAALSLVGAETSWRPISLSPARTLASLLSIVPAVFCCYAVSTLSLYERRLILLAILAMAVATSIFGALQLTAGSPGINFYPEHHVGWVTGFQANRNAAADVLLIGFLALAVLAAPYLAGGRRKLPLSLSVRSLSILVAGLGLLLLAATVMTGSRTGILLILLAGAATFVIASLARENPGSSSMRLAIVVLVVALVAGLVAAVLAVTQETAITRVVERFADGGGARLDIWKDARFALGQYWPVGFGMGGFEPAMFPAERLEFLAATLPNRAHNDFLEIGIEAGILGYIMVASAIILCIAMAWRAWREVPAMRRQVVFAITALLLIALHSIVDYPLRSMAVASLAGIAGGLLARRVPSPARSQPLGLAETAKVHA